MSRKGSQERGGEGGDEGASDDEAGSADGAQQLEEAHEEPLPILNDANAVEEQLQVFPQPGWTESRQRVQQCSDQGGLYWPIVGFAMNQPLHQPAPLVFPQPGWTETGQRVQQCSDQGGLYWPIVGFVMNQPLHQPAPLVFPLPGWTVRGHRLVQCTDREAPHCPRAGNMAVIHPQREPQENDCNCICCRNDNHG